MTTTYILKEPKSKEETLIFLVARQGDHRVKISTDERINPDFWLKRKHRASKSASGHIELNGRLKKFESDAHERYRRYINDHGAAPSFSGLKAVVSPPKALEVDPRSLFTFIDLFITEAQKRKNTKTDVDLAAYTITNFKRTRQILLDFQTYRKRKLEFDSIDLDFYYDFVAYLTKRLKMANNTVGRHIKTLKTFLNAATERGVNTKMAYKSSRFKAITEQVQRIYLNEEEITQLYSLDFSKTPRLECVRDLFVVGCWTGLRFSDLSRIERKNIQSDTIRIKTQKTKEDVVIPLHRQVLEIMSKYTGYPNSLPPAISNQKMNLYLKEIGQQLDALKEKTESTFTKGGVQMTTIKEKWQHLTTHTARRSFATNLYNDKVPVYTIMKITGHRTEAAFFTYIKVTPQESADIIRAHWTKKEGVLKAV
jgi:integrase